jgi:hypothetical protein
MTRPRYVGGRQYASRRWIFTAAFTGALFFACASTVWQPQAQRGPETASGTGQTPGDSDGTADLGATYHAIEGEATRVVTRFTDAVATTERVTRGWHDTRLTDARGRTLATFTVDRLNPTGEQLEFKIGGLTRLRVPGRADRRPTLDWSGRQAYALWKDFQRPGAGAFEWRGALIRPKDAPSDEPNRAAIEVETAWPDGFVATAVRRTGSRRHVRTGQSIRGTSWMGRLKRDGRSIGSIAWHEEEQVLTWSFPGLTQGYLDAERLDRIGGWPFKPDAEWVNVQSLAFHRFHTATTEGQAASRQPSAIGRALGFLTPTLLANTAGCDGLHWLDRTVFRPCCDSHDRCYEKRGCNWSSWWSWVGGWRCDQCNAGALFCFFSGGYVLYQTP